MAGERSVELAAKEHSWGEDNILSFLKEGRQLHQALKVDRDSLGALLPFPPPRFVSIWISEVCNLDCTYCYFSETNSDKSHQYIPTDTMLRWLKVVKDFGAEALEFSGGGEPTLHPDFEKFIIETKKMGYKLGLITHACNPMPIKTMVENLSYVRCGLDAATSKTHDAIKRNKRKDYWFDKAIENIRDMVEMRNEIKSTTFTVGIKVVLNTVNLFELNEMIKLAKDLDVNYIQFKSEHSSNNSLSEEDKKKCQDVIDADSDQITNVTGNVYHQRATTACFMSPIHTVVTATGKILQCCYFENRPIGTIHQPLREVWGGEEHRKVMKKTLVSECDKVDCRWNYYNRHMKELIEDPLSQVSFI